MDEAKEKDETPWGSTILAGARQLADLTVREAAAAAGLEASRWSGCESGRYRPSVRWLYTACQAWSDSPRDHLRWWKLLASAWWFQSGDDQYLMPVLEIGETDLASKFVTAWDLTTQAEQALMHAAEAEPDPTRPIPPWMNADWPGFLKLQRWYRLAPNELQRPRVRQSIPPMAFAAFMWIFANGLWPDPSRNSES